LAAQRAEMVNGIAAIVDNNDLPVHDTNYSPSEPHAIAPAGTALGKNGRPIPTLAATAATGGAPRLSEPHRRLHGAPDDNASKCFIM
jgi:hypothetical protein